MNATNDAESQSGAEIIAAISGAYFARYAALGESAMETAAGLTETMAALRRFVEGRAAITIQLRGPGDPLADGERTVAAVAALGQEFPQARLALTSMGFAATEFAGPLAQAGLDGFLQEISAPDADNMATVYRWIRPGKKTMALAKAAQLAFAAQAEAVAAFRAAGVAVAGYCRIFPGTNDENMPEIAARAAELGLARLYVEPDLRDAVSGVGSAVIARAKAACEGRIAMEIVNSFPCPNAVSATSTSPWAAGRSSERDKVAVASGDGMSVDTHLGQAQEFLIYGPREDGLICLLGRRQAPQAGGGDDRWRRLATTLRDCFLVLVSAAGQRPRHELAAQGIQVVVSDEEISGLVDAVYGGDKKKKKH
ncbi:MAG: hypothetical protein LBU39_05930 [Desulfobulbaceae bacterium]|jgi:nitrogen fixation protein NifB|nr:hypothetical protein [Desulfobulbaceae bacterium]